MTRRPRRAWEECGWWGRPPLWSRVRQVALASPRRVAVVDEQGQDCYGDLWRNALHYGEALRRSGVGRGDIVLAQLPNWRELVTLAVAAETAGVVLAFCPVHWGLRETASALALIRPRLWFTTTSSGQDADRIELVRRALGAGEPSERAVLVRGRGALAGTASLEDWLAPAEPPAADVAVEGGTGALPLSVAVTSGSAGEPKSVVHVHDTALAAVDSTIRRQRVLPTDVVHVAVPVCHTFGYFYGARCALQAGAALVLQERWGPRRMVELADAHGITISLGPSAFVLELLRGPAYRRALGRLRFFTHSGDSLPASTMRRAVEQLPFRISRAFGMTEFGHVTATDETTPLERCVDSVGSPQPEIDIRIADERGAPCASAEEGRILVRGPFLFAGYLAIDRVDEEVLDGEGFFDTGDLGRLGADGFLRITGRAKQVIRRGAETVPVALLEDIIATHPAVQHAVVVGAPDSRLGLGEVPVACVQLWPGADLTLVEIEHLLEQRGVTRTYWPVGLRLLDEWPLGPTGKIDRRSLLARIEARGHP
jgi:cyclohexanecarboxylate-CoA ligase